MRILRKLLLITGAAVLCALYAAPAARADAVKTQMATGNNVGFWFGDQEGGVFRPPKDQTHYWPQGSGNALTPQIMNHSAHCIRDLNGDGIAADTMVSLSRGGYPWYGNATLESYDQILAKYEAGVQLESWLSSYGAVRQLDLVQVWSSKDPDDLANWPVQFREGRQPGGAPVIHGAETLVTYANDIWEDESLPVTGVSSEVSAYFLNFGESNDMVYGHTFMRNMSEYTSWNKFIRNAPGLIPDGYKGAAWDEFMIAFSIYNFEFNGEDSGYAWHPQKEILAVIDPDGLNSGFTKGYTPIFAHKMLRYPSHNGETMEFSNIHCGGWAVQYGFDNQLDPMQNRMPKGQTWRIGMDLPTDGYDQQINPYTGEVARGFPGDLRGTPRENEWAFGIHGTQNYVYYAALHDIGLRDTLSFDYVFMIAYPKNPPLTLPVNEISSIGDPATMEQFEPIEHMAEVAQIVFDGGYVLPETPVAPQLSIIPGDRQVTITWSDANLNQPDAYYDFLEDNGFNLDGYYREYDFEGFRLYRSFSGPNDNHSELLWNGGVSTNDLKFFYVDKIDDDLLGRMRNGMKVWYALVPFDINYDNVSGVEFSLPLEGAGKVWYGNTAKGLYSVIPRSDASNFRPAELVTSYYVAPTEYSVAPVTASSVVIEGSDGLLTQAPVYLIPTFDAELVPIISEKMTEDFTVGLQVLNKLEPNGNRCGRRYLALVDASGNIIDDSAPFVNVRGGHNPGPTVYNAGMSSDGAAYSVTGAHFGGRGNDFHTQIDGGGYSGADFGIHKSRWGWDGYDDQRSSYTGNSIFQGLARAGEFVITWSSGGSGVTVSVEDNTHGRSVPFSPFIDGDGWGFMPPGVEGDVFYDEWGNGEGGSDRVVIPQSGRPTLLVESLASDNTENFTLWVNGQMIHISNITAMPSAGTVFTMRTACGSWNGAGTEFTQAPDVLYPGDKWMFEVKGMSMEQEDIDLSKIRVVPNPYLATSFLDVGDASRRIEFVNLPDRCTIRIFTLSGNLVNVLNHIGANRFGWGNYLDVDELNLAGQPKAYSGWDNHGGTEPWNMLNRFGQRVASGCYFYHVTDARGETKTGSFYIIN